MPSACLTDSGRQARRACQCRPGGIAWPRALRPPGRSHDGAVVRAACGVEREGLAQERVGAARHELERVQQVEVLEGRVLAVVLGEEGLQQQQQQQQQEQGAGVSAPRGQRGGAAAEPNAPATLRG